MFWSFPFASHFGNAHSTQMYEAFTTFVVVLHLSSYCERAICNIVVMHFVLYSWLETCSLHEPVPFGFSSAAVAVSFLRFV